MTVSADVWNWFLITTSFSLGVMSHLALTTWLAERDQKLPGEMKISKQGDIKGLINSKSVRELEHELAEVRRKLFLAEDDRRSIIDAMKQQINPTEIIKAAERGAAGGAYVGARVATKKMDADTFRAKRFVAAREAKMVADILIERDPLNIPPPPPIGSN